MSLKKVFLNTSEDFRGKTAAFYFSLFFFIFTCDTQTDGVLLFFSSDLFAIFCVT